MSNVDKPTPKPLRDSQKYTIGVVCALKNEAIAMQSAFDHQFFEENERPKVRVGDRNSYSFGTISGYYVVLAQMGKMGSNESTDVAADMRGSFPSIKLCLLVGIAAIIPRISLDGEDPEDAVDALMGDIVISKLVKQYDYGKEYPTGFHPIELYPQATADQTRLFAQLETPAYQRHLQSKLKNHLLELDEHRDMKTFDYPGFALDHLYKPDYFHEHRSEPGKPDCPNCSAKVYCNEAVDTNCASLKCSEQYLVSNRERIATIKEICGDLNDVRTPAGNIRLKRLSQAAMDQVLPKIFLGNVAAGNKVMKNGMMRDELAKKHDIIAFEMEGAGIWQNFPTIVIKAACDYGDSHKNKKWQKYACMTAAACAKAFLEVIQMGLPKNVEYGTDNDDMSDAGAGPARPARGGNGSWINNVFSGEFRGSNLGMGNVYNSGGDMHIR